MERLRYPSTLEKIRSHTDQKKQKNFFYRKINSPVGLLTAISSETALIALRWGFDLKKLNYFFYGIEKKINNPILCLTEIQLEEYFSKKRKFFDIPLELKGSEFQKRVWQELVKIPYGKTISYGTQAEKIGRPKAARAVGAANGKNPISIIVPCHRVVGSSGSLTGFAGGIDIKKKLLLLET